MIIILHLFDKINIYCSISRNKIHFVLTDRSTYAQDAAPAAHKNASVSFMIIASKG